MRPLLIIIAVALILAWGGRHALMAQGEPVRAWVEHEDGGVEVYDGGFTATASYEKVALKLNHNINDRYSFRNGDLECFVIREGWMEAKTCPVVEFKHPYSCDGGVCTPQGTK